MSTCTPTARVHSDSWGYTRVSYSQVTWEVDEYAVAKPNFLPMFAVGNDGGLGDGTYTYGDPANCKNCLAVGEAVQARPQLESTTQFQNLILKKDREVLSM